MPPFYIDGKVPIDVTTLSATADVATPYIMQGSGAHVLAVPDPAANDTLAVLTGTQTFKGKTLIMTGAQMSGGIANYVVLGSRTILTLPAGATKTLDFSTADVFIVQLTQACTLTVSNVGTGKIYQIAVQQNIANGYTGMSWMTGFINGFVDSGPTQRTGAIDFYNVTFDGTYHYGVGAKDIQ